MQTNIEEKKTSMTDRDAKAKTGQTGHVVQVIGPTVDIRFEAGALPNVLDAVIIHAGKERLVVETAQHLGNNSVRCIALASTDGVVRGMEAVNTGKPITVPVGRETLGRMFNVLGEPIDE